MMKISSRSMERMVGEDSLMGTCWNIMWMTTIIPLYRQRVLLTGEVVIPIEIVSSQNAIAILISAQKLSRTGQEG
jgi:hypothetical protein